MQLDNMKIPENILQYKDIYTSKSKQQIYQKQTRQAKNPQIQSKNPKKSKKENIQKIEVMQHFSHHHHHHMVHIVDHFKPQAMLLTMILRNWKWSLDSRPSGCFPRTWTVSPVPLPETSGCWEGWWQKCAFYRIRCLQCQKSVSFGQGRLVIGRMGRVDPPREIY